MALAVGPELEELAAFDQFLVALLRVGALFVACLRNILVHRLLGRSQASAGMSGDGKASHGWQGNVALVITV